MARTDLPPGANLAVRRTLDRLIRESGADYASLSRLLGRNAAYVQQFIKRGIPRTLAERDRRLLADHFGVSEELLGGLPPRGQPSSESPAQDDYVLVRALDVRAAAGAGAINETEPADAPLAFQQRWIRSIARGSLEDLSVIIVDGDSMAPTLGHGDRILVDRADREPLRDGIYVLRSEDSLLVKRVAINPVTRQLAIRSDNPAYPSWEACDPQSVDIVGRVMWAGRRLD